MRVRCLQDIFGPFPVMCSTGSCEYNSTAPPPNPPYVPPPPFGYLAVAAIFAIPVVGIAAAAAACAAVRDRRNRIWSARRALIAARGEGEDAAPLLGVAAAGVGKRAARPRASSSGAATLSFENITFSLRTGSTERPVLRGVSGHARAGTLAILGPSGAGACGYVCVCVYAHGGTLIDDGCAREQAKRPCWTSSLAGRADRTRAACASAACQ